MKITKPLALLLGLLFLSTLSVCYATTNQTKAVPAKPETDYQKYLDYVYQQRGPAIDPYQYSSSHTLAKSPVAARQLCDLIGFHCIQVTSTDSWQKLLPDYTQRQIVMRLNRTNVSLRYRSWLVVPNHVANLNYMSLSPFPKHIKAQHRKLVLVDLSKFAFAAYDANGQLVYWGPATGGRKWCSAKHKQSCLSATGRYRIYRIQGANCVSSEYPVATHGGAPMPYCMHYYRGFAIHGSTLIGFENRSQGCIRLFYDDAKWLNHQFVKIGTEVIVKA